MTIGSLRSLGLTTFLLTIPIGIIAALLATRNPFETTEILTQWIGIGVTSQVAMGVTMLLAHRLCQRVSQPKQHLAVIGATVVAGAVRGATLAILADQAGLVGTANIPMRTVSSALIFGLWLLAIGASLSANDRYKAQLRELLQELIATNVVVTSRRSKDEVKLQAQIDEHVRAIRDALEATAALGNPAASARVLRSGIEERIRPLSHDLWRAAQSRETPLHATKSFLKRALRTPPPLTWVVATLGIVFVINSLVWNDPIPGLVAGVTYSVTFIAVLLIGYARRTQVTEQRAVTTLVALFIAPPATVWLVAQAGSFPLPDMSLIAMAIGGVVALTLATMGRTAIDDRAQLIASLKADIDAAVLQVHVDGARQRDFQSRAATHLHNTVQSRLTAATIHLEHAAATHDEALAQATLAQARSVLATVTLPGEGQQHPQDRLEEIASAWAGIATITVQVADLSIDLDPWHLAVDAIEEAVANAVRHGKATSIAVEIHQSPSNVLVSVRDDGVPSEHSAGMGEEWLQRVTAQQWRRIPTPYGSELTLKLPVTPTTIT